MASRASQPGYLEHRGPCWMQFVACMEGPVFSAIDSRRVGESPPIVVQGASQRYSQYICYVNLLPAPVKLKADLRGAGQSAASCVRAYLDDMRQSERWCVTQLRGPRLLHLHASTSIAIRTKRSEHCIEFLEWAYPPRTLQSHAKGVSQTQSVGWIRVPINTTTCSGIVVDGGQSVRWKGKERDWRNFHSVSLGLVMAVVIFLRSCSPSRVHFNSSQKISFEGGKGTQCTLQSMTWSPLSWFIHG